MRAGIAGFALGIFFLQQQAALPSLPLFALLFSAAALFFALSFLPGVRRFRFPAAARLLRFISGLAFGFCWAAAFAMFYLGQSLPEALEGQDVVLTGTVASLPGKSGEGSSFVFAVEHAEAKGTPVEVPDRVLLSWNAAFQPDNAGPLPDVAPGQRWRLTARLKRPHGNANPHGFDYEAWLLQQDIRATGYVRHDGKLAVKNRLLENFVLSPSALVNRARSGLRQHISDALPGGRYAPVIVALVIGDQKGIEAEDWTLFSRSGISHLVSISGLHITLVAGMFAALVSFFWRRSFFTRLKLPLYLPAQKAAAAAGLLMAWVYVLLAGFGVPAQRTLYMLAVVALALWTGRVTRVSHVLFAALGVVLLYDPWAVLMPGFWLSFGAVGIILFVSSGRMDVLSGNAGWKARWLRSLKTAARVQLGITLGLVPLTLLFFGRVSLISPLANAVAIPLVGMVVTPLALAGAVLPGSLSAPVLGVAHGLVALLAGVLEWGSAFRLAVWIAPAPSAWLFLPALAGTAWMLAPKGWPMRWLGLSCWVPLFLCGASHPPGGEVRATALDVGQGSAVLVETRNHRLLYDTGPAYSSASNAGSRVIVPYLNARGIFALDALVISHGDSDHAGGARAILGPEGVAVREVFASLEPGDPVLLLAPGHRPCLAGQSWEWDGVRFEMLWPTAAAVLAPESPEKSNAASCVLKVTAGSQSLLLPGDIGVAEERELVEGVPEALRADVLLSPHHGSRTSSSLDFLATVKPKVAIFQTGYKNRYGHPDDTVYARYEMLGIRRMRSDESGAITVRFGRELAAEARRETHARYWYGK